MLILPPSPQSISRSLAALHDGGVIAHATETCYGLACDLMNPKAVERLFAMKKRPTDQPVSALFSSVEEAKKYVQWNDEAEKLARQYLPGPLTLILPQRQTAKQLFIIPATSYPSASLRASKLQATSSLGIRVSSHPIASQLAAQFGSPLSTTSANIHGKPNPYSAEEITEQFKNEKDQPDLILDSGVLPPTPPSTVINLSSGPSQIVRQGAIL